MSHKIPLMVAAAVAALLVLTAVQAQGPHPPADGPYPRVDVSTTFDHADGNSASGTIKVCNTSEDPIDVTLESIDDNLYSKQGPGSGAWLVKATVSDLAAGDVIPARECLDGFWEASYSTLPLDTINIRNEVAVSIEERDMVFFGRDCFDFR
jgi:hypothetical protein